ncbi:MAG: CRISPR-associated protein Cas4 [Candidatus Aminicenantes bacterium]|nr:CRISPR-associated protein Cas4 [Candidatus Aminicenantes bacterium]
MRLDLTVNDIKQYTYCKRIIFFNHVMPVEIKPTFKMELGKIKEDELRALEKRRKLRRYDLYKGERLFYLSLYSTKYALSGKLDMLIVTRNGYYPVDFKYTDKYPGRNHIYQLGGYALLVEDKFEKKVNEGFIYLVPKNDVIILNLTDRLKEEIIRMLDEMRLIIKNEIMPSPTSYRNRCLECEFRNYCNDVF